MRGRPRTPTHVLQARGSFRKHPERAASRQHEPKVDGVVGEPPTYFDQYHRGIWFELIDEAPTGVLAKSDRKQLELTVRLTAKMRVVPGRMHKVLEFLGSALVNLGMGEKQVEEFKGELRKAFGCSSQELSLLASCFTRMGMTPADRSRVMAPPDEQKDELDDLLGILGRVQ